jgi:hypothetical protein
MTENFSLEELTFSQTATRLGINNKPSPIVMFNLKETATQLERVRAFLNAPINISSGYRSPTLNRAIGGSATSAHCLGFAVDFTARRFGDVPKIVQAIKNSGIKYDQLIDEYSDGGGGWVHISFHPNMRQQTLKAVKVQGKTAYKPI